MVACKEDKKNTEPEHNHMEAEKVSTPKKNLSPHTSNMAMVGEAHIHIDYSSPGVRNRIIFGGLLPYNEDQLSKRQCGILSKACNAVTICSAGLFKLAPSPI